MKIVDVQVCSLNPPPPEEEGTKPWREPWNRTFRQASPRDKYDPPLVRHEPGGQYFVKVTAEDGTWGLGSGDTGNTASVIIDEALAPQVIGVNDLYGQHFTAAMPNTPLIEFYQGTLPGVPLEECYLGAPTESGRTCYRTTPGTPMPVDGKMGLPPGPGFGLQVPEDWLVPYDGKNVETGRHFVQRSEK
jgi:hypothetical protein